MKLFGKFEAGFLVGGVLALVMVGCSGNQIVTAVNAVVTASEAVVNLLPNISPAVKTEVTGYLALASDGVACVNQELNTSDTGVTRALKIAQCFSSLNYSALSPQAQAYVAAVNAAIQALLAVFPTSGTNTARLSAGDLGKLHSITARAASVRVRVGQP